MIAQIIGGAIAAQLIGGYLDAQKQARLYEEAVAYKKQLAKPILNIGSTSYLGDINIYPSPPNIPADIIQEGTFFVVPTLAQLPQFSDKQFASAFAFGVIEEMSDPLAAVREWERVCDHLFISTDSPWMPFTWVDMSHRYIHWRGDWIQCNAGRNIALAISSVSLLWRYQEKVAVQEMAEDVEDVKEEVIEEIEEAGSDTGGIFGANSSSGVHQLEEKAGVKPPALPTFLEGAADDDIVLDDKKKGFGGRVRDCVEFKEYPSGVTRCSQWTKGYKAFKIDKAGVPIDCPPGEECPEVDLMLDVVDGLINGRVHEYSHPTVPSGQKNQFTARYQVVDVDSILPSHNARKNFIWSERYPKDIQDRDYSNPKLPYQGAVMHKAATMDPGRILNTAKTSIEGPPIVTEEGYVLSGNSRAMTVAFAINKYPENYDKYVKYLKKHASQFGIDNKAFTKAKLKHPVLIRRVDIPAKDYEKFASLANESPAMALDLLGMMQAVAKYIPDELVSSMLIEEGETLRAYLRTPRAKRFIEAIASALPQAKVHAYITRGMLTPEGVTLLEGVLFFKLIPDYDLISRMPTNIYQLIEASLPQFYEIRSMVSVGTIPQDGDLAAALPKAVRFYVDHLTEYPLDWALKQVSFLEETEEGAIPMTDYDPDTLWGALVQLIERQVGHPAKMRNAMKEYIERTRGGTLLGEAENPMDVMRELISKAPKRKARTAGVVLAGVEDVDSWWALIKRGQPDASQLQKPSY